MKMLINHQTAVEDRYTDETQAQKALDQAAFHILTKEDDIDRLIALYSTLRDEFDLDEYVDPLQEAYIVTCDVMAGLNGKPQYKDLRGRLDELASKLQSELKGGHFTEEYEKEYGEKEQEIETPRPPKKRSEVYSKYSFRAIKGRYLADEDPIIETFREYKEECKKELKLLSSVELDKDDIEDTVLRAFDERKKELRKLIKSGLDKNKIFQYYLDQDNVQGALYFAFKTNNLEKAVSLLESIGHHDEAGVVAQHQKDFNKALELYQEQLYQCERSGETEKAAFVALKAKQVLNIIIKQTPEPADGFFGFWRKSSHQRKISFHKDEIERLENIAKKYFEKD